MYFLIGLYCGVVVNGINMIIFRLGREWMNMVFLGFFIFIFFFVLIILGMNMILVFILGMSVGYWRILWMMVGELLGVVLVVVFVVVGIVVVMLCYLDIFILFKIVGVSYLVYLGV